MVFFEWSSDPVEMEYGYIQQHPDLPLLYCLGVFCCNKCRSAAFVIVDTIECTSACIH